MRLLISTTVLLALPFVAMAQDVTRENKISSTVEVQAVDPAEIADSIITFVPSIDMALNVPLPKDMLLQGDVTDIERGDSPINIIKRANTMTLPLVKGVPVKIYLKRHPELDGYYPIAIFPVKTGE